jgi:hypothetical protein
MSVEGLFATAYRLGADTTGGAERAIHDWFCSATPREVVALAAVARVSFRAGVWSGYVPLGARLPSERLDEVAPRYPVAVAALLSMHRSGFVRELALGRLAESRDDRVLPLLLLRTDDIVPSLQAFAERAVEAVVRDEFAAALARSLGILEVLRRRARSGRSPLVRRVHDLLAKPEHLPVLVASCADSDPLVRRTAFALRLRAEPPTPVLAAALADSDTGVRLWAARTAFSRATTDDDKRALLPRFEASRSSWTRSLALRARSKLDSSDAPIEAALLDANAGVRHVARTLLRARHPERDFGRTRERALAVLADPGACIAAIVGALGALADVGLAADAQVAAAFVGDRRRRVRDEARRTAHLLHL